MFKKYSSQEPLGQFSMEHPWDEEIQVCSNKVPRVMYGPTEGA